MLGRKVVWNQTRWNFVIWQFQKCREINTSPRREKHIERARSGKNPKDHGFFYLRRLPAPYSPSLELFFLHIISLHHCNFFSPFVRFYEVSCLWVERPLQESLPGWFRLVHWLLRSEFKPLSIWRYLLLWLHLLSYYFLLGECFSLRSLWRQALGFENFAL